MSTDTRKAEWKAACIQASVNLGLAVEDMWASDDPYDLFEQASEAFAEGVDPETFIREIFEEDLARNEHDDHQAAEAFESECEFDSENDAYEYHDD
jgi:flagellar motor component MotA